MKNRMKKTFALILALVMCLSLTAVCSFAANEEPVYDVSGSKTAEPTELTAKNDVTTVTLKLPSAEYQNKVDIVFVMDNSTSTKNSGIDFSKNVEDLLNSIIENNTGVDLKIGIVKFRGYATDMLGSGLTKYDDSSKATILAAVANNTVPGSGSNGHSGLVMAEQMLSEDTEVDNDHKYVVFLTDGKNYIWNNAENEPVTIYQQWLKSVTAQQGGKPNLNQYAGITQKENGAYPSVYNSVPQITDHQPLIFSEGLNISLYDSQYYTNLYNSTHEDLIAETKYDQPAYYTKYYPADSYVGNVTVGDGTVTARAIANTGTDVIPNMNGYKTYYEYVPQEGTFWENINYMQINPYKVVLNEEDGKYYYDTAQVNEDFFLWHPSGMEKGTYVLGHYWKETIDAKYNTGVIVFYDTGSGTGSHITQSFDQWLVENSDYGAWISNSEQVENLFTGIDNSIRYMVASGTVTDVIPADFTLENPDNADGFRMTLNGEALDVEYVEADGTWGFGVLNEGIFPYVISYNADTQTITWEINVPVENLKPVTLSYDLKLTDEAKATVDQGSSKEFDTNVSAVLAYETSDGDKGEYPFEIPVVTYSVPAPPPPPTPTTYTVTYVDGLGNTLGRFPGLSYGEDTPVIDDPTRTGYVFTGWDPEVSATVKKSVTYTAQWAPLTVIPIQLNGEDHFAYVQGYPDGTVRPENNITRAETATMFYRLLTPEYRDRVFTARNDFSDVAQAAWFNKAVSSMANGEFILGYPDGTFMGDKSITRAEFVTVMVRFLDAPQTADNPFSDVAGHWAEDYITAAVAAGWVDGYPDGTFKPDTPITRAEAMKIINSVLHRGVNETSELGDYVTFPDNSDAGKWYYYEVIEATNDHEYTGARPDETWTSNTVDYVYDFAKYENP